MFTASISPVAQRPTSPIEQIEMAADNLAELEKRVIGLSARLAGSEPQPEGKGGQAPVPNGILQSLGDTGAGMNARIDRMHQEIGRIENLLP